MPEPSTCKKLESQVELVDDRPAGAGALRSATVSGCCQRTGRRRRPLPDRWFPGGRSSPFRPAVGPWLASDTLSSPAVTWVPGRILQRVGQQSGQPHQVELAGELAGFVPRWPSTTLPAAKSASPTLPLSETCPRSQSTSSFSIRTLFARADDLARPLKSGHFDPVAAERVRGKQQIGRVDLSLHRDFVVLPAPPPHEPSSFADSEPAIWAPAMRRRTSGSTDVERQPIDLTSQVSGAERVSLGFAVRLLERRGRCWPCGLRRPVWRPPARSAVPGSRVPRQVGRQRR